MNFLQWFWRALVGPPRTTTTTTTKTFFNNIITGDNKMKIALCVGINKYPNPANNLSGCVNDANDMASLLKDVYKFDEVVMLLDSDANYSNVTNAISNALAKKPDVFAYTNSSHGTRAVDFTKTEDDGYNEAICLYDKFLWDYDFKKLLAKADPKTNVIVFSDSCHSCGVTREFLATMNDFSYVSIPKYLPPKDNMDALHVSMMPIARAIFEPRENMNEVLLAGCKSDQFSFDASFSINGVARPNGAFTYYALKILNENPSITYDEFIKKLNVFLPSGRYPQTPVCETNSNMKSKLIFS
jgi:hypothetical protein